MIKKIRFIMGLVLIVTIISFGLTGCKSNGDHPASDQHGSGHPKSDQQKSEHPASEHSASEHPTH